MQNSTRPFVSKCLKFLPLEGPVYEFGSLQVHNDGRIEDLRPLFEEADLEYIGCDMRDGPGVDQVQNLHNLEIEDNSVGCIISMDTLEHVEFPRKAIDEIHRVLKPNGIAILSSVFEFPIHGYPNDYWRFTPNGFLSLMQPFNHAFVYSYGRHELHPQTIAGVAFKGGLPEFEAFDEAAKNWEIWHSGIAKELHKST